MLKKSRRLSSAEVSLVIRTGKGASSGLIRVKFLPRPNLSKVSRFAVVVSKKVLRRAVDRNKVRRQVYTLLQKMELPSPTDAAVFVSSGTFTREELEKDLTGALARMHTRHP